LWIGSRDRVQIDSAIQQNRVVKREQSQKSFQKIKHQFRHSQLDPDILLDFNAVGVERVIPIIEVKN